MNELDCRLANRADVPGITAIWIEGMVVHADLDPRFPLAPDAKEKFIAYLTEVLQDKNAIVFVAEATSQILGYCLARVSQHPAVFSKPTYGYINDLFVSSGHRRKGVGKALFDAIARSLRDRGIKSLEVALVPGNAMASAFWRKQGFKQRLETLRLESDAP
jgi:ribosomal protein S18 acetylase RimI-like enzyme